MRGVIAVAILLYALTSIAAAQNCAEICKETCLASQDGKCLKYGPDPACEFRKRQCEALKPEFKSQRPPSVGTMFPPTWGNNPRDGAGSSSGGSGGTSPPTSSPMSVPDSLRLVPARVYLHAADIPPASVAAYGIVAFRSKPTPANREHLFRTCVAYAASLPRQNMLPSSIPVSSQMLTIWPLDNPAAKEALNDDCNFVIDHYDLFGGISAIQDAQRQGGTLDGTGPFLIGWSPSNARGVSDKVVLVIDLSSLESQQSLDEAFLIWQKRIVEDPTLWVSGFSVERIRLVARDFLDHYGPDVIKFWGGKKR